MTVPAHLVASIEGDMVLVCSKFPERDQGDYAIYVRPGESFGGRSYAEWQHVATGPGRIEADWLNV